MCLNSPHLPISLSPFPPSLPFTGLMVLLLVSMKSFNAKYNGGEEWKKHKSQPFKPRGRVRLFLTFSYEEYLLVPVNF